MAVVSSPNPQGRRKFTALHRNAPYDNASGKTRCRQNWRTRKEERDASAGKTKLATSDLVTPPLVPVSWCSEAASGSRGWFGSSVGCWNLLSYESWNRCTAYSFIPIFIIFLQLLSLFPSLFHLIQSLYIPLQVLSPFSQRFSKVLSTPSFFLWPTFHLQRSVIKTHLLFSLSPYE